MQIALQRMGVHPHYIDIIRDLYTDQVFTTAGFRGNTCKATPRAGFRQGCPLSPYQPLPIDNGNECSLHALCRHPYKHMVGRKAYIRPGALRRQMRYEMDP